MLPLDTRDNKILKGSLKYGQTIGSVGIELNTLYVATHIIVVCIVLTIEGVARDMEVIEVVATSKEPVVHLRCLGILIT